MSSLEYLRFVIFSAILSLVLTESPCKLSNSKLRQWTQPMYQTSINRPLLQETVTTIVNVSLTMEKMTILDPTTMVVEYQLAMTQKWQDHRLAPDDETRKLAVMGAIWQPKITFATTDMTIVKDSTQFWRGTSNGSVIYSEKYSVKSDCSMDMKKYPFDTQKCILKISSYRFTLDEVNLKWDMHEAVMVKNMKNSTSFKLFKIISDENVDYRDSGNFSVLVAEFFISRNSRHVILTSMVPSIILVIVSYSVFWLEGSAINSRVTLCIFAIAGLLYLHVLTSCTVICIDCIKALDIWFGICTIFTLLPLLESIIVSTLHTFHVNKEDIMLEFEINEGLKMYATWIDKILRLLHPVGFLSCVFLFHIVFIQD
ncbi:glycine receptor subunit beta-type 4 isoform X2 [Cephus cinctus]|uniref:Glycine receptor subunit beta-type 4 isoform X2 n=1 Tax=Cephus cinctus TaxID=211228 RepID=A0AAJ7FRU8_CEPCN|nr:glycine receptor subunit beta-type 4 isoform X2 [Cephus cinctus]